MMTFPVPIHYSRETSPGWDISDWETANHLLQYQNLKESSFSIFEKPCGSYLQCAGAKTFLTVEARICHSNGEFNHYVFGKGPLLGKIVEVPTKDFSIQVDESQVLKMKDTRLILRPWLEGEDFSDKYARTDVTFRFK